MDPISTQTPIITAESVSCQSEKILLETKETMTEPVIEPPTIIQDQQSNYLPILSFTGTAPEPEKSVVLSSSINIEEITKKILKVLHVYTSYTRVTGVTLPTTLDYFGKTLLGNA